jgi:hypothetical protein
MWGRSMKKDSWRDVKVSCKKPGGRHDEIKYEAPRFMTEMKVKQMMKDDFPDGPLAAKRAQRAYWEWDFENRCHGWNNRVLPENCEAKRWEAFYSKVVEWTRDQEARGVMHGYFDFFGADFSGLNRRRSRGRSQ